MRKLLVLHASALILLLACALVGCAHRPASYTYGTPGDPAPVPERVVERTERTVISIAGEEFYTRSMSHDPERSRCYPPLPDCANCAEFRRQPSFLVVYRVDVPGVPFPDGLDYGLAEVTVDTLGQPVGREGAKGIPRCSRDPRECDFAMTWGAVRGVAVQAGLEEGVEPWRVEFVWAGGDIQSYVWSVECTLVREPGRSGGRRLLIDANSGEVRGEYEWEGSP